MIFETRNEHGAAVMSATEEVSTTEESLHQLLTRRRFFTPMEATTGKKDDGYLRCALPMAATPQWRSFGRCPSTGAIGPEAGVRRDAQKQSSAVVRRRVPRGWAVHIVVRLNSHSEMSRKYKRLELTPADYLV